MKIFSTQRVSKYSLKYSHNLISRNIKYIYVYIAFHFEEVLLWLFVDVVHWEFHFLQSGFIVLCL